MSDLKSLSNDTAVGSNTASFVIPTPIPAPDNVFFYDDFSSGDFSLWSAIGDSVVLDESGGVNNTACARIDYTDVGTVAYVLGKKMSNRDLTEIYIKFNFKQSRDEGSTKFCKIHGQEAVSGNYANASLYLRGPASDSPMDRVGLGPGGSTITNDTQQLVKFNGLGTEPSVIYLATSGTYAAPVNEWQTYQGHVKFNTNGNSDGVVRVWVNGELRMHATNVKNRADSNPPIDKVTFGDFTKGDTPPWSLFIDNVAMSESFIQ